MVYYVGFSKSQCPESEIPSQSRIPRYVHLLGILEIPSSGRQPGGDRSIIRKPAAAELLNMVLRSMAAGESPWVVRRATISRH